MRRLSFMFLCMMILVRVVPTAQAQPISDCDRIKAEAEKLRIPKENEVKRYQELTLDIMNLTEKIAGKGFDVPKSPHLPLPEFDDAKIEYHDDRNYDCTEWGGTDWGKIKDIREANLDKYSMLNDILARELIWLREIKDSVELNGKLPSTQIYASNLPDAPVSSYSPREVTGMVVDQATFRNTPYRYCIADPRQSKIKITPNVLNFERLQQKVEGGGNQLLLAMNAGMFERDRRPVGLLIIDGQEIHKLNTRSGTGNFYMKNNGVFGINKSGVPFIVTRKRYYDDNIDPGVIQLATQSGPMLLMKNQINPEFTPNSKNKFFRNGVGITVDGKVVFAISDRKVNFYEFASFFKSVGCTTALYLDGTVSRMYVPMLSPYQDYLESDRLGPILYIIQELN
ncbi:MAG: phosphodiester glycosidase family protein [Bacteroidota bacterium]